VRQIPNVAVSALGPGCVKTSGKIANKKIGRSKRSLWDFLRVGKGNPTHENFKFLRFYTASVVSGLSHTEK
jgi:hypothetical protein